MDTVIAFVIAGAALAGFAQGLSGFAFGLVAMSVWAWFLEPQIAAPLAVSGALLGQSIGVFTVRRGFNFRLLRPFLFGGLIGIPIGIFLIPYIHADVFKFLLGVLLILFCPVMLFSSKMPHIHFGGAVADGIIGMVGGAMSSIGGFAGSVPTLWCTLRGMDKVAQRAIIQNFSLAILAVTMAGYIWNGNITDEVFALLVWVIPAVIISVLLGSRLYIGISDSAFRKIILTLLTGSGLAMLISSLPRLFGA